MSGNRVKVAVVTGANKGIGLSIVKSLCYKFAGVVYLTARDETRGREAVAELEKLDLNPIFHQLDIESPESVQVFVRHIRAVHGGVDVLVNNAAIAYFTNPTTAFAIQAEHTLRVNFFATLRFCKAIFPFMRPHSRVVNISSGLGHLSKINGKEPEARELRKQLSAPKLTEDRLCNLMQQFVKAAEAGTSKDLGWSDSAYAVSKVGISALTRIQQRAFDAAQLEAEADIVVNAVHPGWVRSDMTGGKGMFTVDQGAEAAVWCALLPHKVTQPRGAFVWRDTQVVDWVNGPLPTDT